MGAFISTQPNGLYCRFSTVVDCPTHYNMTREEYISNVTGTVKDKKDGEDTLRNFLMPFSEVKNRFKPINMTEEEFDKLVKIMSEKPKFKGFKTT
ncbi:hypothetical protein [Clostridium sp. CTA-6]